VRVNAGGGPSVAASVVGPPGSGTAEAGSAVGAAGAGVSAMLAVGLGAAVGGAGAGVSARSVTLAGAGDAADDALVGASVCGCPPHATRSMIAATMASLRVTECRFDMWLFLTVTVKSTGCNLPYFASLRPLR